MFQPERMIRESRRQMSTLCASDTVAIANNDRPPDLVNPETWQEA